MDLRRDDAGVCGVLRRRAGRRVNGDFFAPGVQVNSIVRVLVVCAVVAAGIALAAATLQARDRWFPRAPSEQRLLYLTNGRVADRLSLSFDSVVSDVYWIRTVQYYAQERKSQRLTRHGGGYELL